MKRRWLNILLPPIIVFFALGLLAEAYIRWQQLPLYLLPAPSAVFQAMHETRETLLACLLRTASAALLGFAASGIVGVLLAILLSSSRIVQRAVYPYTVFFQTVPVVAIAPLLVIWFEAGLQSVAICAFIVSVFPVITNTMTGLLSTDPLLRDMFTLYGAGSLAKLFKLRLPSALPNIFTGLRIAAGLSVIGTIVGEFVATELSSDAGLGIMIATAARYGQTDRVFAAILSASLLGIVMLSAINLAGHLLLRHWHASEQ